MLKNKKSYVHGFLIVLQQIFRSFIAGACPEQSGKGEKGVVWISSRLS